ncbi:MAG: hypothetical protein IJY39_12385 [Clostridia bacterium]|nr:hypothetical protein [Clostridia bacterium]
MRDNKDFDESKLDAAEIKLTSSNRVLGWLENFWYYHKWKVIIILFFAVILTVGVVQMVNKEESDATVVVAVPADLYAEHIEGIDNVLTALIPTGGESGAKNLTLITYPIYSEDELKAANEAETDEDGKYVQKVLQSYNTSKIEEYRSYLQTGECSILFVSEYLYANLRDQNRLRPVSEVFGEAAPAGTMSDGYGIRLGDTYLYEYFDELKVLPEDTVICLMRSYIWGASSDEEKYGEIEEYYKKIVTFGN